MGTAEWAQSVPVGRIKGNIKMAEADLQLVIQKLDGMDGTLKEHGETLRELSKILTSVAVQDQQLKTIEDKVDALWGKMDIVREHQAHCPKEQISRLWWALGILTALWGATLANFIGHGK